VTILRKKNKIETRIGYLKKKGTQVNDVMFQWYSFSSESFTQRAFSARQQAVSFSLFLLEI
jgi:hypothetical protein